MRAGRLSGIILVVLGVIATVALVITVEFYGYAFEICIGGPAMLLIGIAMIAFPGADISVKEFNALGGRLQFWKEAPISHRIAWVVAGVIGITIGMAYFFSDVFLTGGQ